MKKISLLLVLLITNGINSIAQNGMVTKNIKTDFGAKGDGINNDAESFKEAAKYINNRGGFVKLIIPFGEYIVNTQRDNKPETIKISDNIFLAVNVKNVTIVGGKNANGKSPKIKYASNLYYGSFYIDKSGEITPYCNQKTPAKFTHIASLGTIFYFEKCKNIILSNLNLDGNIENQIIGGIYGDYGIQLPHIGIYLSKNTDVSLNNMTITSFGEDGIYIKSNNTKLNKVQCLYNGRQGVSWVDGDSLTARESEFSYTGTKILYSKPGAGIDFEPEFGNDLHYARFTNCNFKYNYGYGIVNYNGKNKLKNVQFDNCTIVGYENYAMVFMAENCTFNNCKFYGDIYQSYVAEEIPDPTKQMKFTNCIFSDVFKNKITKNVNDYSLYLVNPYVNFTSCIFNIYTRKALAIAYKSKGTEQSVFSNCTFNIKKSINNGMLNIGDVPINNCTFKINNDFESNIKTKFLKKFEGNTILTFKDNSATLIPFSSITTFSNCFNSKK